METKIPPKEVFNKVSELDKKINDLYEEKDKLINSIIEEYGIGEWVAESDNKDKPYLRLTVVDNLSDFAEGKTLFKAASFKRYGISLKELKNKPKEK